MWTGHHSFTSLIRLIIDSPGHRPRNGVSVARTASLVLGVVARARGRRPAPAHAPVSPPGDAGTPPRALGQGAPGGGRRPLPRPGQRQRDRATRYGPPLASRDRAAEL